MLRDFVSLTIASCRFSNCFPVCLLFSAWLLQTANCSSLPIISVCNFGNRDTRAHDYAMHSFGTRQEKATIASWQAMRRNTPCTRVQINDAEKLNVYQMSWILQINLSNSIPSCCLGKVLIEIIVLISNTFAAILPPSPLKLNYFCWKFNLGNMFAFEF